MAFIPNPFIKDRPLEVAESWIGDTFCIEDLKHALTNSTNICVLGEEGSGKTSLLMTALSFRYRKDSAVKRKKLIYFANLSNRKDSDDLCDYLTECFKNSLDSLVEDSDELENIKKTVSRVEGNGETRFQNIIRKVHDEYGYIIVIVMDNFERFVMSKTVNQNHHECLRTLIESGCIQCIVATNYDLTQDSLPEDIKGSYLLQEFTHSIVMKPFSEEDIQSYLTGMQRSGKELVPVTKSRPIFNLSGGIPKFVNIIARNMAQSSIDNKGIISPKDAIARAREDCEHIMDRWCELLTERQVEAIEKLLCCYEEECRKKGEQYDLKKNLAHYDFTGDDTYESEIKKLLSRGLLKNYIVYDRHNNPIKKDYCVCLNSLFFQRYCIESKMKKAALENPLIEIAESRNSNGQMGKSIGTYVEKIIIDNSQNLTIRNSSITTGLSVKDLLEIITEKGSTVEQSRLIGEKLNKQFQTRLSVSDLKQVLDLSFENSSDYDARVDEAFEQARNRLVQDVRVDEYEDIIDVTASDLQTLDERFQVARKKIHADLSDEIVENQSERCQFFLKLAVVVEEALSISVIEFEDYSAQLILYCKVIEQSLRDNLFNLFHKKDELAEYSPSRHSIFPGAQDNFRHLNKDRCYIGNFANVIAGRTKDLAALCTSISVEAYTKTTSNDWELWWSDFASDIQTVRLIRNSVGHAGSNSPGKNDLLKMYEYLIGNSSMIGLLPRVLVGKVLYNQFYAPSINQVDASSLIGKEAVMKCTKVKTSGGIRGRLDKSGFEVNISPKKVHRFQHANSAIVSEGDCLKIRVLEFKSTDVKDYFSAEIVESLKTIDETENVVS